MRGSKERLSFSVSTLFSSRIQGVAAYSRTCSRRRRSSLGKRLVVPFERVWDVPSYAFQEPRHRSHRR